jgi:hypothetical protein
VQKGHRQNDGLVPIVKEVLLAIRKANSRGQYLMSTGTDEIMMPGAEVGFFVQLYGGDKYFVTDRGDFFLCPPFQRFILNRAAATSILKEIKIFCDCLASP